MHEVLSGFIHGCAPDPATRTAATAAFVLSQWQLSTGPLTSQTPSMLLIRPEGTGPDPIDDFVRTLVHDEKENEPRVQREGPFVNGPINLAPKAMENAMHSRWKLGEHIRPDDLGRKREAEAAEEKFRAAQVTGHGYGRARPYSKAWHPDYGLLTDADDQLILRLNNDEDRSGFCRDLLEAPGKIVLPLGPGANLFPVVKTVSISGALTPDDLWTNNLAGMMLASGRPFFVLPHVADAHLRGTGLRALRCFAKIWQSHQLNRVEAAPQLPCSDWVRRYHLALRERLAVLPLQAMFPILQAIHQLEGICERIVGVARGPHTTEDQAIALLSDLYHHTLRGLVIGVASHLWFGVGLMPGEAHDDMREKAERLLRRLRDKGPATMTDLLKNFHFSKRERDSLLEQLAGLGLLQVDGSTVAATSYRDFVEGLYASDEFPAVESLRDSVLDGAAAKAQKGG
jgi:hypothetical protein